MSTDESNITRRMLLILGMHRSGTSAAAGTFSLLGVDFSKHLLAPAADNPKGYFEHADIWQQDHAILESLGSAWDDPLPLPADWRNSDVVTLAATRVRSILRRDFAMSPLAGIKDPRMCRLMSLWRPWLRAEGFSTGVVLVLRQPSDVIASLAIRDELSTDQAALVWLRHVLEAERDTRGMPRTVVCYENLMRDWRSEVARVSSALDIAWPRSLDEAAPAIDAFLEPGLRHHRGVPGIARLSEPLASWTAQAYTAIAEASDVDVDTLDRVAAQLAQDDRPAAVAAAVLRRARTRQLELQRDLQWCDNERLGLVEGNRDLRENLERHVTELAKTRLGAQELKANLDRHIEALAESERRNQELRENNQALQENLSQASANLAAVYASRSWRITRPIRGVARLLRRIVIRLRAREAAIAAQGQAAHAQPTAVPQSAAAESSPLSEGSATAPAAESSPPSERRAAPSAARAARARSAGGTMPYTPTPDAGVSNAPATVADPATALEPGFAARSGPRILIVTPDILGPIRNGGIGTAFAALAQTLAQAGRAVTILYTLGGHTEDGHGIENWQRHYAALGIRFVPIWLEKGEPILDAPHHAWRAYRVYLWLKQHQNEYELVYFPEWKGEAYYALQAKRLGLDFARLRMIIVTHSSTIWADSGNYVVPQRFDDLLLEFLERRSTEMADAVVSPSQYMLDWMKQRGWRWSAPVHVIQNLMPDVPVEPAATGNAAFTVTEWVFFGRLERRKGLLIFLDALKRMPAEVRSRVQITFLGKAINTLDYDSQKTIQEKLDEWVLSPKLITDYGRDQALDYLRQPGRLAVIASLVENSPYTVLECVLKRIPFIAADVGGIAELVHPEDRDRALFKPTPAGLATALLALDGSRYVPPRPAVPAARSRQRWLDLQDQLLREIPEPLAEPDAPPPHITVCLVHYDRPGLLGQAIDSLRQQTYAHFDVVLVDDGSPSVQARQYLDDLQDEFAWRGWTIVRQPNGYLGAARNNAVRHARGDYVLFMDDDNLAKPDELAVFARAARNSGADILTTVSDIFSDADGAPGPGQTSRQLWIPLGNATGLGVFRNVFGDANALVRRETFLSLGGFTEDYGIGHEDWEFFARAVIAGANLQLVPEPLFWYRVDAASMLRGGDSQIDHARSLRPYREGFAAGIGHVLAYAAYLHHRSPSHARAWSLPGSATTGEAGSGLPPSRRRRLWMVATGVFRPAVRARFREVLRASGWRAIPVRIARYMGLNVRR